MSDGPDDLLEAARAVQANAHAPYSRFRVGAAVRGASGRVYVGCNVENASFPEGICAEAAAIGAMVAAGERELVEVLTIADGERLTTCCGGCRQRIRELAPAGTRVHAAGPDGVRRTFTIEELLPASFSAADLPARS
jgi:cytidine deaminase